MSDENADYSGPILTHWYTDWCPVCENAIMISNRYDEWCHVCGYSRKPEGAPLDSQEDDEEPGDEVGHLAGLA